MQCSRHWRKNQWPCSPFPKGFLLLLPEEINDYKNFPTPFSNSQRFISLYATHNSVRAEICYSILMEMVTGELFVLSTHLSARACHRVKVCGHGGHTDVPVTRFGVLQAKYIRTQSPFSQVHGNKIIFFCNRFQNHEILYMHIFNSSSFGSSWCLQYYLNWTIFPGGVWFSITTSYNIFAFHFLRKLGLFPT